MTHIHFCKHCDITWSCQQVECTLPVCGYRFTTVKNHGCEEQKEFSKRMAIMLSDRGQATIELTSNPYYTATVKRVGYQFTNGKVSKVKRN